MMTTIVIIIIIIIIIIINELAVQFLNDLGHRITFVSTDDREAQFLFQRLSIAISRHLAA